VSFIIKLSLGDFEDTIGIIGEKLLRFIIPLWYFSLCRFLSLNIVSEQGKMLLRILIRVRKISGDTSVMKSLYSLKLIESLSENA
jgi:hypothetical protein